MNKNNLLVNLSVILIFIAGVLFVYLGTIQVSVLWKVFDYVFAMIDISYAMGFFTAQMFLGDE